MIKFKAKNKQSIQADQKRLYQHVEFLTTEGYARHHLNFVALNKTADYIRAQFEKMGYLTEDQNWKAGGHTYSNIIASYNKEAKRRLIVGAHYDVCGEQPGADDNASAVAGLLETARMIIEAQPDLDYRIDFVAYCLEEPPYFATKKMGSYIHAESLHQENVDVIGMICYEMIGYFDDRPNSQTYPVAGLNLLYGNVGDFIVCVSNYDHRQFNNRVFNQMKKGSGVRIEKIAIPDFGTQGIAGLSDHRNYWKFGYPAMMINDTSFYRNANYHEKTDDIDSLDFEKMTAVVSCAYWAVVNLEGS